MKGNKIFSIITIMFVLAFLFAGCGILPKPTPTKGTISGQVLVPPGAREMSKDISGWVPASGATVKIVDANGKTHTVITDEDGHYTFENLSVDANTVVTATVTINGEKMILKTVIDKAVSAEEDHDAGSMTPESTALALVVEEMIAQGISPQAISLAEIQGNEDFAALEDEVTDVLETGGDVTESGTVTNITGNIADDILNPPEPPEPTPPEPTPPEPTPPEPKVSVSAVSVDGVAKVGETLTATPTPSGATVTYKWMICDTEDGTYEAIDKATNDIYTLTGDDVGKYIKVEVKGTGKYTGTKTSDAVGPVVEEVEVEVEVEVDLTAYEEALSAVEEANYTEESWAKYQEVVEANVVTAENTQEEVDAATAAIVAAQADLVEVVEPVEPAVELVEVTPAAGTTIEGVQEFTFGFKSVTGELEELEIDMYLGDTGEDRNYNDHLGFGLPADNAEIVSWIGQAETNYNQLDAKFQSLLNAAGYVDGSEDNQETLKSNIFYTAGEDGAGTWTLKLDTAILGEDKIEFLVAVTDDQGAKLGNNNYTAYPNDVKAYAYDVTLPEKSMTVTPITGSTIEEKEKIAVSAEGADDLRIMLWAKELESVDAANNAYYDADRVFSARLSTVNQVEGIEATLADGEFTITINEALINALEEGTKYDGGTSDTGKYTWKSGDKTTWIITPETEGVLWEEYNTWDGSKVDEALFVYNLGIPDTTPPIVENIVVTDSEGTVIDTGGTLSGEVTFAVTASDNKALKQLNLDIVKESLAGITDEWGILQQLNVYADEDDPVQTQGTQAILEALGISVTYAADGTTGTWTIEFNTAIATPKIFKEMLPEGHKDFVFPDGDDYSFNFKAKDMADNYSSYKSVAFGIDNPDTTAPVLEEVTPAEGNVELAHDENFVLTVQASDENLYELEVDHSLEGTLPEFSLYASAEQVYGDAGQEAAFTEAGVEANYNEETQTWTIDFGQTVTAKFVENGITFYLVAIDEAGNQSGSMYEVTEEMTFAYTVTKAEAPGIQAAIDDADEGGTIEVAAGTYEEAVEINKANLTLKAVGDVTITKPESTTDHEKPGIAILANMGEVTIEGFKVKGFRNGISQGILQSEGTKVHVINNKVWPESTPNDGYMRNGIQVTGDGSTVTGNTVHGEPLTAEWASTAIHVVNANNVIVEDNTVTGPANIGIGVLNYNNSTSVSEITIKNNTVTGSKNGVRINGSVQTDVVENITVKNNTFNAGDVGTYGINIQKVTFKNSEIADNGFTGFDYDYDSEPNSQKYDIRISGTSATIENVKDNDKLIVPITGVTITWTSGGDNPKVGDELTAVLQGEGAKAKSYRWRYYSDGWVVAQDGPSNTFTPEVANNFYYVVAYDQYGRNYVSSADNDPKYVKVVAAE